MKIKNLLLTLVLSTLSTTNPVLINSSTTPQWTYQTIKSSTIDANFGDAGSDFYTNTDGYIIYTMQIQTDGKILIAGSTGTTNWYVGRLLNDIHPLTQITENGNTGFIA
ncbi:MAG: hypothetical protein ACJAZS_000281 [Alteromonas naphthalenivorans]|jgi:hypothetical protein